MSLFDWVGKLSRRIFPASWFQFPEPVLTRKDLLNRLNLTRLEITRKVWGFNPIKTNPLEPHLIPLGYWWHRIPKKSGGFRLLYSPNPRLKLAQKLLLRRVFAKLKVHDAAKGFRRGESTATHARLHLGKAVVVRIDIKDFFHRTKEEKIYSYFRYIGWDREAATLMTMLCTRKGSLPQGAPTSPILSNLVNYRMDARLAGLAAKSKATYSRYADDLIFSFPEDNRRFIRGVIRRVVSILHDNGYQMNRGKLRVMRQHNQQLVTGLVVNQQLNLPRKTRRWLRAIEHHIRNGKSATLTHEQLAGWKAYLHMIQQSGKSNHDHCR